MAFWSGHKIATSLPAPLIGFLVSTVVKKGLHSRGDVMQAILFSVLCFLAAIGLTFIASAVKAPKLLDDERQAAINARDAQITEHASAIEQLTAALAKPKWTTSQQRNFALAKSAIEKHGLDAVSLLQHLQTHREIRMANWYMPNIPHGMDRQKVTSLLEALYTEHVVNKTVALLGVVHEEIWTIAPGVESVLDALLYPESSSESSQT